MVALSTELWFNTYIDSPTARNGLGQASQSKQGIRYAVRRTCSLTISADVARPSNVGCSSGSIAPTGKAVAMRGIPAVSNRQSAYTVKRVRRRRPRVETVMPVGIPAKLQNPGTCREAKNRRKAEISFDDSRSRRHRFLQELAIGELPSQR